jgi:Fe-S-cluster containining protein
MKPTNTCSCSSCVSNCRRRPGWFKPGEAELAAALLGLSLPEFFKHYLAVDWWVGDPNIYLLAPATDESGTGVEYPGNPEGRCVFLGEDERCQIHEAKPFECATAHHARTDYGTEHHDVAQSWKDHQQQVVDLLGREPDGESFSLHDLLTWVGLPGKES